MIYNPVQISMRGSENDVFVFEFSQMIKFFKDYKYYSGVYIFLFVHKNVEFTEHSTRSETRLSVYLAFDIMIRRARVCKLEE